MKLSKSLQINVYYCIKTYNILYPIKLKFKRLIKEDKLEDYEICSMLKGLIEGTDRRFKAVLSGLHDVQRTTVSNNPLAHLGKSICIGSFMSSNEPIPILPLPKVLSVALI